MLSRYFNVCGSIGGLFGFESKRIRIFAIEKVAGGTAIGKIYGGKSNDIFCISIDVLFFVDC